MAKLRTTARWIQGHDPFIAGNPVEQIKAIATPEPVWQGLTDLDMVRMKAAADQLLMISAGTKMNVCDNNDKFWNCVAATSVRHWRWQA